MKKVILLTATGLFTLAAVVFSMASKSTPVSGLLLANIQALAETEPDGYVKCFMDISCDPQYGEKSWVYYCAGCKKLEATKTDSERYCKPEKKEE